MKTYSQNKDRFSIESMTSTRPGRLSLTGRIRQVSGYIGMTPLVKHFAAKEENFTWKLGLANKDNQKSKGFQRSGNGAELVNSLTGSRETQEQTLEQRPTVSRRGNRNLRVYVKRQTRTTKRTAL